MLAFMLPIILLTLAFALRGIYPFGNRHILTVDLFHQYAPFLAYSRANLLNGGSWFYSFAGGLGVNVWALAAYYLLSPFNLILLMFPPAFLTEAIFLVTLLKVGCAGAAFNHFLKRHFGRRGILSVVFGVCYALSAFVMAYFWNVMWLDTILLLPLVLAALIRLIRDKHILPFVTALFFLLVTQFYLAFFASIFILLYYPFLVMKHSASAPSKERFLIHMRTLGSVILALGMSAAVLYPVCRALQLTSASGDAVPATVETVSSPLAFFAQQFTLLQPTIRSGLPNLYAGVFLLLLVPLYFFSRRIALKEKLYHLFLLVFLLLSFDVNWLNFLWHGMHYPNQLPHRFSFLCIFLLLVIGYDALASLREFRSHTLGVLTLLAIIIVPLAADIVPDVKQTQWTQWVTIVWLLAYGIVMAAPGGRQRDGRAVSTLLTVLIALEILINSVFSIYLVDRYEYFGSRDGYATGPKVHAMRTAIDEIAQHPDAPDFYRLRINQQKSSNDPFLYGYRGVSIFASTFPCKPVKVMKKLGYASNGINSFSDESSTRVLDSLFNVEFMMERDHRDIMHPDDPIVLENDEVKVYQNPTVLPLGFYADRSVLTWKALDHRAFDNQNELLRRMCPGSEEVFKRVALDPIANSDNGDFVHFNKSESLFHFDKRHSDAVCVLRLQTVASEPGLYYLECDMRGHKTDEAEVTAGEKERIPINKKGLTEIGYVEAGTNVSCQIRLSPDSAESGELMLRMARLDMPAWQTVSSTLCAAPLVMDDSRDGLIRGSISAPHDGVVFLSIPHDADGWYAYVDGQRVRPEAIDDCFMTIPVTEGHHRLKLQYFPPGFLETYWISLISMALFLLLVLLRLCLSLKARRKARANFRTEAEQMLEDYSFTEKTSLSENDTERSDDTSGLHDTENRVR